MICLDTNYLILGLTAGSREGEKLVAWNHAGETFCTPAIAWYEFRCGPINNRQEATMRAMIQEVIPFDSSQAEEAARLFNAVGRRRTLRVDAMIAAAATSRGAPLATDNLEHFEPFVELGLELR